MQQFTVPQFIDVEAKIIGPITTRQFVILLIAAALVGISYRIFDFSLFVLIAFVVISLAGTLAFLKINGRPFHFFILNFIQTLRRPGLRVWNHKMAPDVSMPREKLPILAPEPVKELYKSSRLAELSLVVDTKGRYRGEEEKK